MLSYSNKSKLKSNYTYNNPNGEISMNDYGGTIVGDNNDNNNNNNKLNKSKKIPYVNICQVDPAHMPFGEPTEYGWHILPDRSDGWGPIYFSIMEVHLRDLNENLSSNKKTDSRKKDKKIKSKNKDNDNNEDNEDNEDNESDNERKVDLDIEQKKEDGNESDDHKENGDEDEDGENEK